MYLYVLRSLFFVYIYYTFIFRITKKKGSTMFWKLNIHIHTISTRTAPLLYMYVTHMCVHAIYIYIVHEHYILFFFINEKRRGFSVQFISFFLDRKQKNIFVVFYNLFSKYVHIIHFNISLTMQSQSANVGMCVVYTVYIHNTHAHISTSTIFVRWKTTSTARQREEKIYSNIHVGYDHHDMGMSIT